MTAGWDGPLNGAGGPGESGCPEPQFARGTAGLEMQNDLPSLHATG